MDFIIIWDYMFLWITAVSVTLLIVEQAVKAYNKKNQPELTEIQKWERQYQKDVPTVWVSEHTQ